jgi:hypothetical protein
LLEIKRLVLPYTHGLRNRCLSPQRFRKVWTSDW